MRKLSRKKQPKFPLQPIRKRQHLDARTIGVIRANRRILASIGQEAAASIKMQQEQ